MKIIYHMYGDAENAARPEAVFHPIEPTDMHPDQELTAKKISLVNAMWYGDGSVFLEVFGYDEAAVRAEWLRFKPIVVGRLPR